jgi:hypothetical protein
MLDFKLSESILGQPQFHSELLVLESKLVDILLQGKVLIFFNLFVILKLSLALREVSLLERKSLTLLLDCHLYLFQHC